MKPRIMVIAKAPLPGLSKTRLCPPCSHPQAAELAEAALADTLETVAAAAGPQPRLVLEGEPGEWLPEGFEVVPQASGGLGNRLAAAFTDLAAPALLIGMDTPQVGVDLLERALGMLEEPDTDAVLGLCFDGGYWAIGFDGRRPGVFEGVPMSTETTGEKQLERMRELGMEVRPLPELADVDYFEDALRVARERPDGRFAAAVARLEVANV